MKYSVLNLGCKVNRVESDHFERMFHSRALVPSDPGDADIIIVNTCTVTGDAEKKARKLVRSAVRANDRAHIIITGCASAIAPDVFEAMSERITVVSKHDIDAYLEGLFPIPCMNSANGDVLSATEDEISPEGGYMPSRSRVGVKIQDGCDNECSYCIVCKARGVSYSIGHDKVLAEIELLVDSGIKEILLTGIDLGAYNDDGYSLDALLRMALDATASPDDGCPPRFRISSIEPTSITDGLISLIKESKGRICRHLHIPLQSGSDKVLTEMCRRYSVAEYASLIAKLKREIPEISITTDIIVGFPGEMESDFEATLDLAKKCAFSNIHVFPYSPRALTVAAARQDQIAPDVKVSRARKLRALASRLRDEDAISREGATELFCVQEDGNMMSESYYEHRAPAGVAEGALLETTFVVSRRRAGSTLLECEHDE